jgi:hypothetical protein
MRKKGYEIGSRNVFKDLGIPNAEEHLVSRPSLCSRLTA